ncbi:hypothetical protein AWZ03_013271 [Drosophila navojoa]|uniref:Uncharacterized protein n=1 Tax=Drosophila navojoa TaxID=7232 RepID=A0A484AXL7_DRONA|nr:hypothetical protein AWZ03_013271 [Drosophila navojoa]
MLAVGQEQQQQQQQLQKLFARTDLPHVAARNVHAKFNVPLHSATASPRTLIRGNMGGVACNQATQQQQQQRQQQQQQQELEQEPLATNCYVYAEPIKLCQPKWH